MSHQIKLNIYDLSQGLATQLSPMILGYHIKAIYHTSITVYDREWFFNSQGVQSIQPYTSHFGQPIEVRDMSSTEIPEEIFRDFIDGLDTFKSGCYEIWENNCNDFTKIGLEFLNDGVLDDEISGFSRKVMNSSSGELLRNFMMGMSID